MKKIFMLAAMVCCLGVNAVNATETVNANMVQVNEDPAFVGKWNLKVSDTPMGDMEVVMTISKTEDGVYMMKSEEVGEVKGELKDGKLTFMFDTMGVDVDMVFEMEDADTLKGMSMGEWPMKGTRIKE